MRRLRQVQRQRRDDLQFNRRIFACTLVQRVDHPVGLAQSQRQPDDNAAPDAPENLLDELFVRDVHGVVFSRMNSELAVKHDCTITPVARPGARA